MYEYTVQTAGASAWWVFFLFRLIVSDAVDAGALRKRRTAKSTLTTDGPFW